MKRHQIGCALFLLAFGAFICWEARKLDYGRVVRPGPGFFPFWLGLALMIVSLAILFHYARKEMDPSLSSPELWKGLAWEKVLYSLGGLLLYAFFLERVGYIIGTFLLLFFFFRVIEPQRWAVAIFGSVFTSFVTYALFKLWLQVQLPVGLWGM